MRIYLYSLSLAATLSLSGCMSDEQMAMSQSVIEALPDSVSNCVFLGNVDTIGRVTLKNARDDLKYEAATLGASHVVETLVYTAQIGMGKDYGPALSGRAYKCPVGEGPVKTDPKALLPYEYVVIPFDEPEFF